VCVQFLNLQTWACKFAMNKLTRICTPLSLFHTSSHIPFSCLACLSRYSTLSLFIINKLAALKVAVWNLKWQSAEFLITSDYARIAGCPWTTEEITQPQANSLPIFHLFLFPKIPLSLFPSFYLSVAHFLTVAKNNHVALDRQAWQADNNSFLQHQQ